MRFVSVFMLLLFSISHLQAQDESWFSFKTTEVGLEGQKAFRINVVDIDNDDYPDIILVEDIYKRGDIRIYLNRQDPSSQDPTDRVFINWTDSSMVNVHPSLDTTKKSDVIALADVNNDGYVDIINGIWHYRLNAPFPDDRCEVLLNDGTARFHHVENDGFEDLGRISSSGFTFLDYDLDGNIDVYIAAYWDDPAGPFQRDRMMRGNGDGTFEDVSSSAGMYTSYPMQGASAVDWNNDGWPDIMTSAYCRSGGSLLKNNGQGQMLDVSHKAEYSSQHMGGDNGQALCQWGAYPYDYDNDGDMDVLQVLVHGGLDINEGRTHITNNLGPNEEFRLAWDLSRLHRMNPQSYHLGNMDGQWLDIDNDMLTDVVYTECSYLDATDRLFVFRQDNSNHFWDISNELGFVGKIKAPHTLEALDYDLDGDYDLLMFANAFSSSGNADHHDLLFLENNIGNQNNWIGVRLGHPSGVNYDAIGARIIVYAGGVRQMRDVQAGRGHFSGQMPFDLVFGLGANETVDSIIVRWPRQPFAHSVVYNIPANQYIDIDGALLSVDIPAPVVHELEMYPNPVRNVLHLGPIVQDPGTVEIYDALGRIMYRAAHVSPSINCSGLQNGIYLVVVRSGGTVSNGRFIVAR